MERAATVLKAALLLVLALHVHHKFRGPPVDYFGLAAAAAASWVGVPGPGEPVLIAAAIFAARHRLDITTVIGVAFLGAVAGGMAGWAIGFKAGRALVTLRGPFHAARLGAVERGEQLYGRHPFLAVMLTPSWVAGINHMRAAIYTPANALAAAVWAVGIGLGAYFAGPPIVDLVDDFGVLTTAVLAGLVVVAVGAEVVRRRRKRARSPAP